MIKKLKLNFIVNTMILVSIAISMILSAICLLTYIAEETEISKVLDFNIRYADSHLSDLSQAQQSFEGRIYDVSFTVLVDSEGNVISGTQTSVSDNVISDVIYHAMHAENTRGNITRHKLSFTRMKVDEGTLISFVSREHLTKAVKESVLRSITSFIVGFLIFLYISKRLADLAIAPVEKAWEQQRQFLADASHDLKTPITVILANNNIISSHQDKTVQSQMKWIESTSEEAGRMSDLINKMLELAKGEEAKEELKIGEIDLSEVVENSILQFEVVAFEKNLTIESGVQPNMIVRAHRPTVSKVLEILFDNAIKYSDENGKISVALYKSSKKIYFTINNKGEYIKPDELPHVFERFYRTNKEREVGGHGLGLSIAKKKCDMIGCKLSVESTKEEGTTFTITFKSKKQ